MTRRITVITVTLWLMVTAAGGYFYVINRIHSSDAIPGYETDWYFQLVAFSAVRLPLFVLGLALILFLERRLRAKKGGEGLKRFNRK